MHVTDLAERCNSFASRWLLSSCKGSCLVSDVVLTSRPVFNDILRSHVCNTDTPQMRCSTVYCMVRYTEQRCHALERLFDAHERQLLDQPCQVHACLVLCDHERMCKSVDSTLMIAFVSTMM